MCFIRVWSWRFDYEATAVKTTSIHSDLIRVFDCVRPTVVQRLPLQRLTFSSHELRPGRRRHPRLPEDHGKQSRTRRALRHPVATAMVESRRRGSWPNLLPEFRRAALL